MQITPLPRAVFDVLYPNARPGFNAQKRYYVGAYLDPQGLRIQDEFSRHPLQQYTC